MFTFLSIVYVIVCTFLVLVVLLQSGKGGGMGAIGGGGGAGSTTVFGGAGAGNFLTRLTAVSAALFMILSASLAYLSTKGEQSLDRAAEQAAARRAAATEAAEGGAAEPEPGEMSAPVVEEGAEGVQPTEPNLIPPVEGPEEALEENVEAREPAGTTPPSTTMAPVAGPTEQPDPDQVAPIAADDE